MEADRNLLKYFYDCEKISLKNLFNMVTQFEIDRHDFHWITGLNYDGIKKSREW